MLENLDGKQKMIVGGIAIAVIIGLYFSFKNNQSSQAAQPAPSIAPTSGFTTAGMMYIPTTSYAINDVYGTQSIANTTTNNQTTSTQVGTSIAGNGTVGTSTTGSLAAAANAPGATTLSAGNNSGNTATNSNNTNSNNTSTATTTNSPGARTISDPVPWRVIPPAPAPAPKPAPAPAPPPPPAPRPAPPPQKTYTVQSGDSLWAISQRYTGNGMNWQQLYNANRGVVGSNPNLIYPGQRLVVPF